MKNMSTKLLLFDVDGTLIYSGGAGRRAMLMAFEQMYGVEDGFKDISMFGKTDPLILREALANHGLEWRQADEKRFKGLYVQLLRTAIHEPYPEKRIMPGVVDLLTEISRNPALIRSLLTGNWKEGSDIKLGYFDLNPYFELGTFSDDSPIREELVPIAVRRWEEKRGIRFQPEDVFIIGDTPLDIQCARPFGARTISVATGIHTREELLAEHPDHFFPDLSDTPEIMRVFVPSE
jgi:phosphoglycolate phosphatase